MLHQPDRLGQWRECDKDFALAVASAVAEPEVAKRRGRIFGKIVKHQTQFARERADARMPAVDEFTAQFAHLAIGKMVAQAKHAPADPFLRLIHAHANAGLA